MHVAFYEDNFLALRRVALCFLCLSSTSLPSNNGVTGFLNSQKLHMKLTVNSSLKYIPHFVTVSWLFHERCFIFLHQKRLRQDKTCSKVSFYIQYARQNFGSTGLHLVNRLYAFIHKTQSPCTKILPFVLNEEIYFSPTSENLLLHYAVSLLIS